MRTYPYPKRGSQWSRWYYRAPGMVYAHGPSTVALPTERVARAYWRSVWGVERLTRGAEVWRA